MPSGLDANDKKTGPDNRRCPYVGVCATCDESHGHWTDTGKWDCDICPGSHEPAEIVQVAS